MAQPIQNPPKTEKQEILAERPKKRIPVHEQRNRIKYDRQDDGYQYRMVSDTEGRIQTFLDGGYEFVCDGEARDKTSADARRPGNATSIRVGTDKAGNEVRGYLMRIPKKLFDQDQRDKLAKTDLQEDGIKKNYSKQNPSPDGQYGEVSIER